VTHGYTSAFSVAVCYTLAALALALFGIRTPPKPGPRPAADAARAASARNAGSGAR
jgi:hypothetical protein